jgi:hypothetical protein
MKRVAYSLCAAVPQLSLDRILFPDLNQPLEMCFESLTPGGCVPNRPHTFSGEVGRIIVTVCRKKVIEGQVMLEVFLLIV